MESSLGERLNDDELDLLHAVAADLHAARSEHYAPLCKALNLIPAEFPADTPAP